MKTNQLSLSTPCPACQSSLSLKALGCSNCGCEVRGAISLSPLARLDDELSHFLMVFVHCGGKIGDVEKALGISYPTVKAKLAKLQADLTPDSIDSSPSQKMVTSSGVMELLKNFEAGVISYDEMTEKLKKIKEKQ